jgi:hypothetical protein
MSELRQYKSKSNSSLYIYLFALAFMAVAMFCFDLDRSQLITLLFVIHLPAVIAPFALQTYYIIGEENIIKKDINHSKPRTKYDPQAFLIPIRSIDEVVLKMKRNQVGTLILKQHNNQIPLGKITIENTEEFIAELKEKKTDIRVIGK